MATISAEGRNEALDALLANVNSGKCRIYTGSAPALPTDAATGTLLAELDLNATAFAAASGAVATANAVTADAAADASGTGGYMRLTKSDGTTGVIDLVVGGSMRVVGSSSTGLLFTTTAAHGKSAGDAVQFFAESGGALPTGIAANTTLYVIADGLTATAFKVSTSLGGGAVPYTDAGTNPIRVKASTTEAALASSDGSIAMGIAVSVASMTFRM